MATPRILDDVANAVLTCVCESMDRLPVDVPGLMGCPCRHGVVAGTPAADGCDNGCQPPQAGQWPGQLTVHVARLYASDATSFPREVGTGTVTGAKGVRDNLKCAMPQVTAVEFVITVFRCAPLPSDEGCPPSMEALGANALQIHADMMAVQRGLLCCLASTDASRPRGRRYVVGQTRSLGPQGGCAGFESRVTVAIEDCIPCPA